MEVDDDLKAQILAAVGPSIAAPLAGALVAAAGAALLDLITTNHESDTPFGKQELHPTGEDTTMADSEVTGAATEGTMAKDEVSAANGEVKAAETEARATTGEATALTGGAAAVRTKAGASDIEVKALKMT
ncbi:MAG: hypothetical protein LBO04_06205 [Spirochaetaceae bacterium]|jgi:hypothetical protein|nr:hypothetical protein [Spirochaetaceae bacterium]